jgi:hypothetical protein
VKFLPRNSQIIGRMVIHRSESQIIRVDESKVTKFILVDAVGDEAAAAGIHPGNVVVPTALGNIIMNDGFRPVLEEKNVAFFVTDAGPDEFLIQTDTGTRFVPLDSSEAAQPLGAQSLEESKAA